MFNHARPDRYGTNSEPTPPKKAKNKTTKQNNNQHKQTSGSCLDKTSQSFPWDAFGRVWGKSSPAGREPTGQESKSVKKPTYSFLLKKNYLMSPILLTTPGHPSHHLFTYFNLSLHLGRIQHHTKRQWLPLCVIFSTTRDGRVYLSVPTPPSYKMAVLASFGHIEHHTRW